MCCSLPHMRGKDIYSYIYLKPPETKQVKLVEQCSTPRPCRMAKASSYSPYIKIKYLERLGGKSLSCSASYTTLMATKLPLARLEKNHLVIFELLGCITYQKYHLPKLEKKWHSSLCFLIFLSRLALLYEMTQDPTVSNPPVHPHNLAQES